MVTFWVPSKTELINWLLCRILNELSAPGASARTMRMTGAPSVASAMSSESSTEQVNLLRLAS